MIQTNNQQLGTKPQSVQKGGYIFKGAIVLFLTTSFLIYRIAYNMDFTSSCIFDALHQLTYPINRSIDADPYVIVIFIGQQMMDISVISIVLLWFIKSNNMRLPCAAAIFYALRTICLAIQFFPFPDDMAWRSPFISSIMVPYDHTRDFYFSGHTGLAVIISLEVMKTKMPLTIKIFSYIMIGWFIFMLISTRVHYSIDIIGGILFGFLSFDSSMKYLFYLDYFWSLPFLFITKLKNCFCEETIEDNRLMEDSLH